MKRFLTPVNVGFAVLTIAVAVGFRADGQQNAATQALAERTDVLTQRLCAGAVARERDDRTYNDRLLAVAFNLARRHPEDADLDADLVGAYAARRSQSTSLRAYVCGPPATPQPKPFWTRTP